MLGGSRHDGEQSRDSAYSQDTGSATVKKNRMVICDKVMSFKPPSSSS